MKLEANQLWFHLVGQLTISQATRELEVAPRSNMRDQSPTCRAGSFEKHMIDSTVIFGVKRLHYLKNLNDQDWRWSVDPRSGKSCSQFEGLFSQMLLVMQPSYEQLTYNLDSIQMGQTMWYHSHVIIGDGEGWHERLEKSSWTDAHIQVI